LIDRPTHARIVAGGVPTALFFAIVAAALVLRRSHAAVALVVSSAAFLVAGLFVTSRVDNGPVAFFVALIVAFYSAGAWGAGYRDLMLAVVAFVAIAVLDVTRGVFDVNGPRQPVAWLVLAIAWVVGRELGRRRGDVAMLADRAARLEQEQATNARAAVQEERARIARELHDVVAHSVSVMVVQAQAGPRLTTDPAQASSAFAAIEHSGREALVELRRMLGILRTDSGRPDTEPQPGLDSLPRLVEHVAEAGLSVRCVIDGEPQPLPPGVDLSAYRIVQEALTNTLKHARAETAEVTLRYRAAALEVEVVDDGRGGETRVGGSGHGLIGMRERASLHGGELAAGPRGEGGFAVRARLPLQGAAR
jgi:signal transduction histidine kinase